MPVEEWRRTGIPHDYPETQRHALVCVAASCTRRGLHPERDTLPILREIADASPVLRPTRPWTDTDLRFIAHNVADGTDARTARDNARAQELAATVDWEIPS